MVEVWELTLIRTDTVAAARTSIDREQQLQRTQVAAQSPSSPPFRSSSIEQGSGTTRSRNPLVLTLTRPTNRTRSKRLNAPFIALTRVKNVNRRDPVQMSDRLRSQ